MTANVAAVSGLVKLRTLISLVVVGVPTGVAMYTAVLSGFDPDSYYRGCHTSDCEFVPRYIGMAMTALFMAAEGALVFYALAGPGFWPLWTRAAVGLIPLPIVGFFLFMTLMHAPRYHYLHLEWAIHVGYALLAIMVVGLITGLISLLRHPEK